MNDPVFLVTGAASGVGLHLVGRLAALGHRVVATDLDNHRLEEACRLAAWPAERVRRAPLDVRQPRDWEEAFALAGRAFGGVDVLLHAAGYLRCGPLHAAGAEEVHRHLDVNTKGTAFALQAAAAHMLPRGHGHVVVFSSVSALAPVPGLGLYSASKFASRALCLAADHDLRPRGVAVTVICPDGVDTPMAERIRDDDGAALIFAAARLVPVEAVGDLGLGRVLRRRPREVSIPPGRAWLARLTNLFPGLNARVVTLLERRGRAALARRRAAAARA